MARRTVPLPPVDCDQCGRTHERCHGHNTTGAPCQAFPKDGATVCRKHGGAAPQVREKAAERVAAQAAVADATAALAHVGVRGVVDPLAELSKLATEAVAFKDALASRVNALDGIAVEGMGGMLRAELGLYERALDRTGRFLDVMAKHGVLERAVAIQEEQQALLGAALGAAMKAAQLTAEQREAFTAALREHLG